MDVRTVSRWFGACSLVVGSVALTVGTAIEPSGDDDSVAVALGKISRHLGRERWLIVADLLAVFMLPAILCLMRCARRGAPRLALAGGSLAFAGWLAGLIGLGALDVLFYRGAQAADRPQAVALVKATTDYWTSTVLLLVFIVGQVVGMLLLGVALWRSHVAPRWAAALIALCPIVQVLVHDAPNAIGAAVYALVAIAFAACAVTIVRGDDGAWDLPVPVLERHDAADVRGALAHATPAGR